MTQAIDPEKLKAAAEHLEWVLQQYPDNDDVQGLLRALAPLIRDSETGTVLEPVKLMDIPGAYNNGDGLYAPYKDPDVGAAYARFVTEIGGGISKQAERQLARLDAMLSALREGSRS
ncbi:MAG TPA: hypothetical protein VF264_00365 [Rhodanobacteraceae bacterium]